MQSKNPPANCIHAFSKDGDQIFINRSYAAEQTRANYLSGDVEEEIRYMSDLYTWKLVFYSLSLDFKLVL